MITAVILCGGSGTRLWPLSRAKHPKQFQKLFGDHSLLEDTLARVKPISADVLGICNEDARFMTAEQFRRQNLSQAKILLEPIGRNTAPATAAAAQYILDHNLPPLMLLLPSDHIIGDVERFHLAVQSGIKAAEAGNLVTFGVKPSRPETGYGYIQVERHHNQTAQLAPSVLTLKQFVEKPTLELASQYVKSGDYFWNSGMFLFHAQNYLDELRRFKPDIFNSATKSAQLSATSDEFVRLNKEHFTACPKDSIDYAVMEHTKRGMVVPLDAAWGDIGSWMGVWQASALDDNHNNLSAKVKAQNVKRSYVHAEDRLVVVTNLSDIVVIDTKDALLVTSMEATQEVKTIVEQLQRDNYPQTEQHLKVYRPWGSYETIAINRNCQVKKLLINPDSAISLQLHHHRSEHWVVVHGRAKVRCGDETLILTANQSTYVPANTVHCLENIGDGDLEIVEVQTGSYFGEDDIIRLEDRYGRTLDPADNNTTT